MNESKKYKPIVGDLVRYGEGATALALLTGMHDDVWVGKQCMGGAAFVVNPMPVDGSDRHTWAACATFRGETVEQAFDELRPNRLHAPSFVDTPEAARMPDPREGSIPGIEYREKSGMALLRDWAFLRGIVIGFGFGTIFATIVHMLVH